MRACVLKERLHASSLTEALTEGRRSDPDATTAIKISGSVSWPRDVTPLAPVGRIEPRSSFVHGPAGCMTGVDNGWRRHRASVLYTRVIGLVQPIFVSLFLLVLAV